MWLLTTDSFELKYFHAVNTTETPYAILSHTWGNEEVTFQEMRLKTGSEQKEGYRKIAACCQQARKDGYQYVWVDTCWYAAGMTNKSLPY
jgi:hypothetical protein